MKNEFLFLTLVLLIFTACKKNVSKNEADAKTLSVPASAFSIGNTKLPQSVDLKQDISSYSLQELRLLRSYPYAIHGLNFDEADIYAFFNANTEWYEPLVMNLWDDDKLPLTYKDVKLSAEEQDFVDKIDKRIAVLLNANYTDANGYKLANPNNIINKFQFSEYDTFFLKKIKENNFVITTGNNLQLFHLYEENDYRQIPSFITTDLYLQAFHVYFSYILKSIEKEQFIPRLTEICESLHDACLNISQTETDAELKHIAEYNATFYAIPYYLLTGKKTVIPDSYKEDFESEITNINEENDDFSSFMSFTDAYFPYSLFKPRGHYTRKPETAAYFKAMMWLQTAVFCREKDEQLKQSIFSACLLNTIKSKNEKPLIDLYNSVYETIVFLVGESDNLSVLDIANCLKQKGINNLSAALNTLNVADINNMLQDLSKTRNQIKPKIQISCPDKINFMPQRYLIDNDVLQNLVDINKNSRRAYPKGLDVFAAFGSNSATALLNNFYKEKDAWADYSSEMLKLKNKFKSYNGWNNSVYNKWIECLIALQQPDKTYPGFMQTQSWGFKNLNTSLASWAELKHDANLYGEQPMAAECGDGGPPQPTLKGYVEPNLQFWNKLSVLVSLTYDLLKKNNLLTPDLEGKTVHLSDMVQFLQQTTKKELSGQRLTQSDYETIRIIGSNIEYFTLSVIDPDLQLADWSLLQGPDKSIAVVADIYTRNIRECSKNGILHVATGKANNIYVVVEMEGYLYLTRGATFSYYEFIQPLNARLTDEEWQQMLEKKKAPPVPLWMKDLIIEKEPKAEERVFYSSGC